MLSTRCGRSWLAGTLIAAGMLSQISLAQAPRRRSTLAKPEPVTLVTRDNVEIRCTYYPGGTIERVNEPDKKQKGPPRRVQTQRPGKEVVPVILIPGWEGRRSQYSFLASSLQRAGHAVITVDLRGQGESTVRRGPCNRARR